MAEATRSICVIPGDGIGEEVTRAARVVLDGLAAVGGPSFTYDERPAGLGSHEASGEALPAATVEAAKAADGVLVGAMDVAALPPGATQPLRGLRRALDVAASVRRSRSLPGVETIHDDIDVLVVREVTEGFYGGIEHRAGEDAACCVRVISTGASTRTARIAFEEARRRRGKVTAVHKQGAMKLTDGVFLDAAAAVARGYPDVELETKNVDACAMELIQEPHDFDTILCTNAFGDIMSDVGAGLAGGLGLAPSGCIGERWAYFEPVHGTAPDIAGRGIANPLATILSAALMLQRMGEEAAADTIERAVVGVLADGHPRTPDLGGDASGQEVAEAIRDRLGA